MVSVADALDNVRYGERGLFVYREFGRNQQTPCGLILSSLAAPLRFGFGSPVSARFPRPPFRHDSPHEAVEHRDGSVFARPLPLALATSPIEIKRSVKSRSKSPVFAPPAPGSIPISTVPPIAILNAPAKLRRVSRDWRPISLTCSLRFIRTTADLSLGASISASLPRSVLSISTVWYPRSAAKISMRSRRIVFPTPRRPSIRCPRSGAAAMPVRWIEDPKQEN